MEHVLSRFNAGDEKAFRVLFSRFFNPASLFVKRFVKDPGMAEDIVQETFIALWERRGVCREMQTFRAYLYRALRNNALYRLRGLRPEQEIPLSLIDEDGDFFAALVAEEVCGEILYSIGKLPPERKRVIEMTLSGHSQEEIAALLGVSVNTVKTQKRHAYAFLREELQHLFPVALLLMSWTG